MRLLVCGGAGFIGSAFVRRMLAKHADWEIVCFDKLTYAGNLDNLLPVAQDPRYSFVRGDIGDRPAVDAAIDAAGGVDAIVNFAAETHVDRSIAEPEAFLQTDILGTHTLLEVVRERSIGRMLQVSTDEVYGSIETGSFCETDRIQASSPYSASKAGGDLQVLAYHTTYGAPVLVTRGSNTYGPYQYPEKLIPLFVTNALEGGQLPLYGDGLNVRDWLHVDDHADGIEAALLLGQLGEVYNIGGGNERTNREITTIILDELGLDWDTTVRQVTDRPGHDRRYSISCAKAREQLGWQPAVDFADGLRDTIRWYRDNEWWWSKIKHHTEEFADWRKRWYDERS
ncbi:MAG: dTDP-glucose 4,6-dehydratase [Actinobacteria bacterium HGW-Actinobacteria-7]|jgi:dTDP-glucose 4,6-dehydratase|nr:MAG: dTDP-glucose 4,6-dehydratase [Actinobacteria bacterium HGW-Actinobacteria-7]